MAKGARLTGEQRKFCEEYVKTYNATQAYLAAHPTVSYDTANTAGPK
jgi:phage terminase small subunit